MCHSYYRSCKTNHCRCSVDSHSQDGVGCVLLCLFAVKVAYTMFMTVCNLSPPWLPKIHDQQSLTLHSCTFSACGRVRVSVHIDHKGGQYIENKPWCTNVNNLRLSVAYMNATMNVKPKMQNQWLEPSGLAKHAQTPWLTGMNPGLANQ